MPVTDLSPGFFTELRAMCARLGCDPFDMLRVMCSESTVDAAAANPTSDASGLIQIMPFNLASVGWTGTPAAFRQLSAEAQLPFVERYFEPWKQFGLQNVNRLYQVVFLPGTMSRGSADSTVICERNGFLAKAYKANASVDQGNKGFITVGDLHLCVDQRTVGQRWNEIVALFQASGVGAPSTPPLSPPAPAQIGSLTRHNHVASALSPLAAPLNGDLVVDSRAAFELPSAARAVRIEIFLQPASGPVVVFDGGAGTYAGQVGSDAGRYGVIDVAIVDGTLKLVGQNANIKLVGCVGYFR
jgi:hypothetical protein